MSIKRRFSQSLLSTILVSVSHFVTNHITFECNWYTVHYTGYCQSASRALHSWDRSRFVSPIQTGAQTLYHSSVRKRERAESCRQAFRAFRYLLASLAGLITPILPNEPGVTRVGKRTSILIPRLFLSWMESRLFYLFLN